jgi:hypothetical protein
LPDGGPYAGVSPHGFCYAAHLAFAPDGEGIREWLQDTGFRALAETHGTRCDDPACRWSESMLGRCLPRAAFDNARRAGLLISTRKIDASPLTLLITRLSGWRSRLPSIAVRQGAPVFGSRRMTRALSGSARRIFFQPIGART